MNVPTRLETGIMTSKGQILIPKAIRDTAGLQPGQPYKVVLDSDGRVMVAPLGDGPADVERRQQAQSKAIDALAGRFSFGGSTDEVMRELRGDYAP